MKETTKQVRETGKRIEILIAAKKLFMEKGYQNTSVRQIVKEADTSMGNLYFHFPNKMEILKVISKEFVDILRRQIGEIRELGFSPEFGFALDFRIGYITTLEDPKLSQLWCLVQNMPEIHHFSLENKKLRLQTFFGERIDPEELDMMSTAVQGIADAMFRRKRNGYLAENPVVLSNTIIDYSLRLLEYPKSQIQKTIYNVESYIEQKHISVDAYFNF